MQVDYEHDTNYHHQHELILNLCIILDKHRRTLVTHFFENHADSGWKCRIPSQHPSHQPLMKRNMHSSHNLKRHLRRFHNDLFVKIQQQHHNGDSDEVISASIESALQPNQRQKSIQVCVEQMKMRVTQLAEAVAFARINLYLHHICHGLSFRSVEHIHFERFMNALGKDTRVTGSRHEFRRIIPLLEKFVLHKASMFWG